jgi:transcriptional regulator, tetR family
MKESPEQVASALKSLAQDSEKLAYEKYRESYRKMKGTT